MPVPEPYADGEDFEELFPDEAVVPDEAAFRTASRHVDSLTYNRIAALGGFEALTDFQKEVVREVVCRQALFESESVDALSSVLSSYSIGGVSMGFAGESWNVHVENGVAMQRDVYALLRQTGLCVRVIG